MASQDDIRENAQKKLFKVADYSATGRGNGYTPDGMKEIGGRAFNIEFKTKPEFGISKGKKVRKSGVSTARKFGTKKVEAWQDLVDVFIFSEFEGVDFNGNFTEHYALSFEDLRPILEEKVVKPYNKGRKPRKGSDGYYGMKEFEENILPLLTYLSPEDTKRLMHTIEAGASLNDPKFSWKDIKALGTKVETEQDLCKFCEKLTFLGQIRKQQ